MKKRIQVTLIMCCFVACSILMSCSVSAEKGAEKMDPLQSQISLARDYFNEGKLHLCFGILLDLLKGEPDQNTLKSIASITGDIYHNKLFPEIKHLSHAPVFSGDSSILYLPICKDINWGVPPYKHTIMELKLPASLKESSSPETRVIYKYTSRYPLDDIAISDDQKYLAMWGSIPKGQRRRGQDPYQVKILNLETEKIDTSYPEFNNTDLSGYDHDFLPNNSSKIVYSKGEYLTINEPGEPKLKNKRKYKEYGRNEVEGRYFSPQIFPDGQTLFYALLYPSGRSFDQHTQYYIDSLIEDAPQMIYSTKNPRSTWGGTYENPRARLSKDGRYLVTSRNDNVYFIDLKEVDSGIKFRRITFNSIEEEYPSLSPNQTKVALAVEKEYKRGNSTDHYYHLGIIDLTDPYKKEELVERISSRWFNDMAAVTALISIKHGQKEYKETNNKYAESLDVLHQAGLIADELLAGTICGYSIAMNVEIVSWRATARPIEFGVTGNAVYSINPSSSIAVSYKSQVESHQVDKYFDPDALPLENQHLYWHIYNKYKSDL